MKSFYGPVIFIPQIFLNQSKLVDGDENKNVNIWRLELALQWFLLSQFASKLQADNPI